jgi:protein TonB
MQVKKETRRWGVCVVIACSMHAALAAGLLYHSAHAEVADKPAAAMVVSMVSAASLKAEEPAPQPQPVQKHVQAKPVIKPKLAMKQVAAPKVTMPSALAQPQPAQPQPAQAASTATAAASMATATTVAENASSSSSSVVALSPSYIRDLLRHLERYKHYPVASRRQHEQGVVYLRFKMNESGNVLAASIERSSGYAALDEEVEGMIKRADPLPQPPATMAAAAQLEMVVPVQFYLR